jgi:hypothetical protein
MVGEFDNKANTLQSNSVFSATYDGAISEWSEFNADGDDGRRTLALETNFKLHTKGVCALR